jgi:hypothetical protein
MKKRREQVEDKTALADVAVDPYNAGKPLHPSDFWGTRNRQLPRHLRNKPRAKPSCCIIRRAQEKSLRRLHKTTLNAKPEPTSDPPKNKNTKNPQMRRPDVFWVNLKG